MRRPEKYRHKPKQLLTTNVEQALATEKSRREFEANHRFTASLERSGGVVTILIPHLEIGLSHVALAHVHHPL